jgi:hypothetical protein
MADDDDDSDERILIRGDDEDEYDDEFMEANDDGEGLRAPLLKHGIHAKAAYHHRAVIGSRVLSSGSRSAYTEWKFDPTRNTFVQLYMWVNVLIWVILGAFLLPAEAIAGVDTPLTTDIRDYFYPAISVAALGIGYSILMTFLTAQLVVTEDIDEKREKQEWPPPPTTAVFSWVVTLGQMLGAAQYGWVLSQPAMSVHAYKFYVTLAAACYLIGLAWIVHEVASEYLLGRGSIVPQIPEAEFNRGRGKSIQEEPLAPPPPPPSRTEKKQEKKKKAKKKVSKKKQKARDSGDT